MEVLFSLPLGLLLASTSVATASTALARAASATTATLEVPHLTSVCTEILTAKNKRQRICKKVLCLYDFLYTVHAFLKVGKYVILFRGMFKCIGTIPVMQEHFIFSQ